jgi:hypothetical protein
MPEVRLTVPWTDEKGEVHAAGEVVKVSDEVATELNNAGKASKVEDEKALEEQTLTSAVYDARAQRADPAAGASAPTAPTPPPTPEPSGGPQAGTAAEKKK